MKFKKTKKKPQKNRVYDIRENNSWIYNRANNMYGSI